MKSHVGISRYHLQVAHISWQTFLRPDVYLAPGKMPVPAFFFNASESESMTRGRGGEGQREMEKQASH